MNFLKIEGFFQFFGFSLIHRPILAAAFNKAGSFIGYFFFEHLGFCWVTIFPLFSTT